MLLKEKLRKLKDQKKDNECNKLKKKRRNTSTAVCVCHDAVMGYSGPCNA